MKRKTVSLCMIARDEEASIGLTIKSVLALVDEVIVADTGSRDNTRIIAEGYGARVVDVPWRDDFAAARNAALAEANCDWILVLDADERLQPVRPVEFQRILEQREVGGYRLQMVSPRNDKTVATFSLVRLFRNDPAVRYRYPIHEQIVPALNEWCEAQGKVIEDSGLSVLHEGYRQERAAGKRDRNLRILRQAVQEYPEEPYFEYQIACETLTYLDDEVLPVSGTAAALQHLEAAWQKVQSLSEAQRRLLAYGPDLAAKLSAGHLALQHTALALEVVTEGRRIYGDHPGLLLQAIAASTRHLEENAGTLTAAAKDRLLTDTRRAIGVLRRSHLAGSAAPVEERFRTLYPLRYEGELTLLAGGVAEAAELFEKALTIDNAYSFAWLGLAECARQAGDRKRALKLYLRTVTENEWNHRAWLRGSELLRELEFFDNAESWRRKVSLYFPEHPAAEAGARGERENQEPVCQSAP
jgi:tetratricopeptide (TPR) repeat protein